MQKKKEVILLEDLATLKQFEEEKQKNVYPLGITLSNEEFKQYKSWKERISSNSQSDRESDLSIFTLISDMYTLIYHFVDDKRSFMLNAYRLREKIANGEIFVNKFIDKDYQVKPVDYISESYGHDMDAPRIVFLDRAKPRKIFRKTDHYDPSKDNNSKGTDLLALSSQVVYKV